MSVQLFGNDPDVMASAAERVAAAGADLIDINMGCPVPKVCKTGAGAALLSEPTRAVAVARAAARGSGLPVTVKLRSGQRPGDISGLEVARRLVFDGGVAGIGIHPRHASQRHKGLPNYSLVRELVEELPVPVLVSGGLQTPDAVRAAFEQTGAAGVLLARGSLGNPWLFEQVLGVRDDEPGPRRDPGRARLGDRLRGRAPRRGPRHAVPAEVLPLVRRAARWRAGAPGVHSRRPRRWTPPVRSCIPVR